MLLFALSIVGLIAFVGSLLLATGPSLVLGYLVAATALVLICGLGVGVRLSPRLREHVRSWLRHLR